MPSAITFGMQTPLLLLAIGFSAGFGWICYQIGIESSKILKAIIGGVALGFTGLYGIKFLAHDSLSSHFSVLPVAALLGATLVLWLQARECLAQKMSRDSVYLLTLTFIYFFSPWQGAFRMIGLLSAAPCAVVLLFCMMQKRIDGSGRVGLMFWTMLASLVIGVQQIWASPDTLAPAKNLAGGFASGTYTLNAALTAAGLVTLVFSLIPFLDWARSMLLHIPLETEHQMMNDTFTIKRALVLTLAHGVPLLLNWHYQYFSHGTMMGFALVWSPVISSSLANSTEPEAPTQIPGWDQDITAAS